MERRFSKSYVLETEKSVEEILRDIKTNSKKKSPFRDLLTRDRVNYGEFTLSEQKIVIERWPSIVNPFRGYGTITFNLTNSNNKTIIKCTYGPPRLEIYFGFGFTPILFIVFLLTVLFSQWEDLHSKVLFIIGIILVFGLMLGFSYLVISYLTNQLGKYSRTILKDLRLIDSKLTEA